MRDKELKKYAAGIYNQSEKGKVVRRRAVKKYHLSEKGKAARKRYRQSEKGKIHKKEQDKRYGQSEKGKIIHQMINKNHQHLKRASGIRITVEMWRDICERFGWRCAYCGIHEEVLYTLYGQRLTMDHVIPLSKGGQHIVENIVPACGSCNSKKGTKMIKGEKNRRI